MGRAAAQGADENEGAQRWEEGVGVAPGKVILMGEHAVVYGHPALAASVDLTLTVHLRYRAQPQFRASLQMPALALSLAECAIPTDETPGEAPLHPLLAALRVALLGMGAPPGLYALEVESQLPTGKGMGSSAAFSVATLRALARVLGQPMAPATLMTLANQMEEVFHGTPSGVDVAVVGRGGLLRFCRGDGLFLQTLPIRQCWPLLLVDSGTAGETARQVAHVRISREADPERIATVMASIEAVTERGRIALDVGDTHELGLCLTENHRLLAALGVSTPTLDQMVEEALAQGALGAKLTGAGGGGLMLVLAPSEDRLRPLDAFFRQRGFMTYRTALQPPSTEPR